MTLLTSSIAAMAPAVASAHFLLIHAEDMHLGRPGDVALQVMFWHPFDSGHVMDMDPPEALYMIHHGESHDLSDSLAPFEFTSATNTGAGFTATLPVRRSGDYVVMAEPAPYYEASEDIYIQQLTKVVMNRNGLPSDWAEPVGVATEILPLNKPYNVLEGSTFTGQILASGNPVPHVEIEIEYLAAEPRADLSGAAPATVAVPRGGALVAISDDNGVFTFGIPKAGWWGFAALGSGPETEHEGKPLSQDAVLWIQAEALE